MHINKIVQDFDQAFNYLHTPDGYTEATMMYLEDLLKENPSGVEKIIKKFQSCTEESMKETYATLIISLKPIEPYKSYLIENHGWEESDFE